MEEVPQAASALTNLNNSLPMLSNPKAAEMSAQETPTAAVPSNLFGGLPQSSSGGLFDPASQRPTMPPPQLLPFIEFVSSANASSGTGLFNMKATGGLFSNLDKTQESTTPVPTTAAIKVRRQRQGHCSSHSRVNRTEQCKPRTFCRPWP
jgi:hypothetical protein